MLRGSRGVTPNTRTAIPLDAFQPRRGLQLDFTPTQSSRQDEVPEPGDQPTEPALRDDGISSTTWRFGMIDPAVRISHARVKTISTLQAESRG